MNNILKFMLKQKPEYAEIFWEDRTAVQNMANYARGYARKGHHSKNVSEWVAEHKAQIRLFHPPPYAPEYDSDAYLDNDLKRDIGTQAMTKDVQELEMHTNSFMTRISEDSEHVKSYFNHPALNVYELD